MTAGPPKLPPHARAKLAVLADVRQKADHLCALVEQATARKSGMYRLSAIESGSAGGSRSVRTWLSQINRLTLEISQTLGDHGFQQLAADLLEIVQLTRRGDSIQQTAMNRMREVAAHLRSGLDLAEHGVHDEVRRQAEELRSDSPPHGGGTGGA